MKKILIIVCAVVLLAACKKERSEVATVTLRFSPYEVSPMKTASVSTVCSRPPGQGYQWDGLWRRDGHVADQPQLSPLCDGAQYDGHLHFQRRGVLVHG